MSEFIKNIKPNATVIDMSSINPLSYQKNVQKLLKEKKINYLDAPVSGGTIGADEASLAIMVGGDEKTFNECVDLLKIVRKPNISRSSVFWTNFKISKSNNCRCYYWGCSRSSYYYVKNLELTQVK